MKQELDRGTLPFTDDRYGRKRKIVFASDKITVELDDPPMGVDPDVTSLLTTAEGHDVVELVRKARAPINATSTADGKTQVVVVTEAMVDACYNHPERVPLPGRRLMKETLERALNGVGLLTVDLPYLHLHARLAGDYLMRAKQHLQHRWNGALDDALNHVDYVKTALEPYVDPNKVPEETPDYKALFGQAMQQLRVLSGSRNSFTTEARERLFDLDKEHISLRTPAVETMHREAFEFLTNHEHLLDQQVGE